MRIATFNLESLDLTPDSEAPFERRAAVLRPQLERLEADVLCLQEVHGQHVPGEAARQLTALERLLAGTAYADYHRVASTARGGGQGVADVHNLVILSRRPARFAEELRHGLVAPLPYRSVTARPQSAAELTLEWDRPLLHAAFDTPSGRTIHVMNLHLRSPLAAPIPGQKRSAQTWRSLAGWAEGFFVATVKRSGQALEARLLVERLFDEDPAALIAVCGDLNAGEEETPGRILRGKTEDSGNPGLAARTLEAMELRLPATRRYSVVHGGRPLLLDHIFCSAELAARCRGVEVDNENLPDEVAAPGGEARSNHAPLLADFAL